MSSVDENQEKSEFSQYNNMVDFTAPGSSILSTTAIGKGGIAWLEIPSSPKDINIRIMGMSPLPQGGLKGPLVLCPNLGDVSKCRGGGRHICVIERYVSLYVKVHGV